MNIRHKATPGTKKLVWRITADSPKGEWIDPAAIRTPQMDAPEEVRGNWAMSSFDLQYGADIRDVSDTVPDKLLDQLFPAKSNPPKSVRK
jgi:hypothetical protein